jgi:hypothetical protein
LKKAIVFLLFVIILPILSSCKKQQEFFLTNYLSDTRTDIFVATLDDLSVTAHLKRSEIPLEKDGVVGEVYTSVKFILPYNKPEVTYELLVTYNNVTYQEKFTYDPLENCLSAEIYPETFTAKSFDGQIKTGGKSYQLNFNSILPQKVKTPQTVLENLYLSQKTYIDDLTKNGKFDGEIALKILVNNATPYYYVAITDKDKNTKAMLLDAITGELLAIKDIF